MCGIVGFFGHPTKDHYTAFEDLLVCDAIRGPHSTGVAGITKKYVAVVKDIVSPIDLMCYKEYKTLMNNYEKFGLIGHNRWATRGAINAENAHPFKVGKITGVHNGTCWLYRFPDHYKKETDSETIFNIIDKKGVDYLWGLLDGAATLVWFDAEEKTLNILRNSERPMHWARLPNNKGIFFASEDWMLRGILGRHKIRIDEDTIFWPAPNKLYTFKYNNKNQTISMSTREIQEWKPKIYNTSSVPFQQVTPGRSNQNWIGPNGKEQSNKPNSNALTGHNSSNSNTAIPYAVIIPSTTHTNKKDSDDGERLQGVNKADFDSLYQNCYFCGEPNLDFDTALVLDPDNLEAVCEGCQLVAKMNGMNVHHIHL